MGKYITCCTQLKDCKELKWRDKELWCGPEESGWSILAGFNHYAHETDCYYMNVNFCPFCGTNLTETKSHD